MDDRRGALDAIKELIREQRLAILRARTIAVTLQSALADFEARRQAGPPSGEALELRREWCERAVAMIQDVRAQSLRTRELAERVSTTSILIGDTTARAELRDLAIANRSAAEEIERAEQIALGGLEPTA